MVSEFIKGINKEELRKLHATYKNSKANYKCYDCGKTSTNKSDFETKSIRISSETRNGEYYPDLISVSICKEHYY